MPDNRPHGHHYHQDEAEESRPGGERKIEKEKWALLGLAMLIAGALVLGVLTHAESLEVRDAMKGFKIMVEDEPTSSAEP